MRTLPTSWNNLHLGNSTPIWLIRIIPNDSDTWQTIRLATTNVFIQEGEVSVEYQDKILKLGSISQSFDPLKGGGLAHVGTFSFTVEKDILPDGIIYNRTVEVLLTFREAAEALEEADLLLLFRGKIKKIKTRQNKAYITAYDEDHDLFKKNIEEILTKDTYPEMADSYARIPTIFGRRWIPLIIVQTDETYFYCKGYKQADGIDFVTAGFKHSAGMGTIIGGVSEENNLIKVPKLNITARIDIYPALAENSSDTNIGNASFVGALKAIDKRTDTYARIDVEGEYDPIGKSYVIYIPKDLWSDSSSFEIQPQVFIRGHGDDQYTDIVVKWDKNSQHEESRLKLNDPSVSDSECRFNSLLQFSSNSHTWLDLAYSKLYIGLERNDQVTSSGWLEICEFYLGATGVIDETPRELFGYVYGRRYGDWARSPYTSTDLIERISHVIEALLRDDLGIKDIDIESFDSITLRGSSIVYGKAEKVFQNILEEYGLFLIKSSGVYKLKILSNNAAAVEEISISDAIMEGEKIFVPPLIKRLVYKALYDEVFDTYKVVKVLESGNVGYGIEETETIESKWIYDMDTLDDVLERKVNFMGNAHYNRELEYSLQVIGLEVGDVVSISEEQANYLIYDLRVDLDNNKIRLKAITI